MGLLKNRVNKKAVNKNTYFTTLIASFKKVFCYWLVVKIFILRILLLEYFVQVL